MSKKILKRMLFACALFICNAQAITVGTYNVPPFSMNEDHENIGLATEIMQALLKKSEIMDYKIVEYPQLRGLYELKHWRIDVFYPYVADINNSEKFVLIGPITKYKISFFVRKDYQHEVSFAAMKNLAVGAERGGISDTVLTQHDIRSEQATQKISCLRMVLAERVVACAMGTLSGIYVATINDIYADLRYVETNAAADMYVALGSGMSEESVAKIKEAYELLKKENYFEIQQRDYERKFKIFIKSIS